MTTTCLPSYVYGKKSFVAHGQIHNVTPKRSPKSNSSEMLWLTCENEEDPIKMKALRGHVISSLVAICCQGKIRSGSFSPTPMLLQIKFDCDWSAGLRDVHV